MFMMLTMVENNEYDEGTDAEHEYSDEEGENGVCGQDALSDAEWRM